jgi:hypothetical protein
MSGGRAEKTVTRVVRGSIILAVLGLAAASESVGAGPPAMRPCGTVSGLHWRFHGHAGDGYRVRAADSTTCAVARAAVPRLTRGSVRASGATLSASPSGYRCIPLLTLTGRAGVLTGLCVRGDDPTRGGFNWAPAGLR